MAAPVSPGERRSVRANSRWSYPPTPSLPRPTTQVAPSLHLLEPAIYKAHLALSPTGRTPADIPPELHPFEPDLRHGSVGPGKCGAQIARSRAHTQPASAGGHHLAVALRCAAVKYNQFIALGHILKTA